MDSPPVIRSESLAPSLSENTRPTWATVIAVIGIVFAVLELISAIATPLQIIMQRFQQEILTNPAFIAGVTTNPAATTAPTTQSDTSAGVSTSTSHVRTSAHTRNVNTQVAVGIPPGFNEFFKQIATPPPWFNTYLIVNGVECLIAGIVLLVGSVLLLQQRSAARAWLFAYAAVALLWSVVVIVIAAVAQNMAFANQAMCATSCGAPLPIVLIIMLLLPAQRQWFARRRAVERTSSPAL